MTQISIIKVSSLLAEALETVVLAALNAISDGKGGCL